MPTRFRKVRFTLIVNCNGRGKRGKQGGTPGTPPRDGEGQATDDEIGI